MSAKNLDPKGRLRSETIAYRCSPAERKELDKRWKLLGYGFAVEPDIYERMLKAAAEYPERFDSMYEVVEKIDDDKIGEEFKQLLELFIRAAGGKGKGRK